MEVFKLSGGGNDFIAIIEPRELPSAQQIRAWCQRGLSLGADGLFVLQRSRRGARMTHFNSDGERSTLCLNGCRTAARLVFHLGWRRGEFLLTTDAGTVVAHDSSSHQVELTLPPLVGPAKRLVIDSVENHHESSVAGWFVEVGVPHFVLIWPDLDRAPVTRLGRELRFHPAMGTAGANINFVRPIDHHRFEIRTYERGVEAETMACGTGVIAAATVLSEDHVAMPVTAMSAGGADLIVSRDEQQDRLRLTGDARVVARCELLDGAIPPFEHPRWCD